MANSATANIRGAAGQAARGEELIRRAGLGSDARALRQCNRLRFAASNNRPHTNRSIEAGGPRWLIAISHSRRRSWFSSRPAFSRSPHRFLPRTGQKEGRWSTTRNLRMPSSARSSRRRSTRSRRRKVPSRHSATSTGTTTRPASTSTWCRASRCFHSLDKFESGTGWPSFTKPLEPENVGTKTDRKFFMVRDRSALEARRLASGTRLRRRAGADRTALLHELRGAALRPGGPARGGGLRTVSAAVRQEEQRTPEGPPKQSRRRPRWPAGASGESRS